MTMNRAGRRDLKRRMQHPALAEAARGLYVAWASSQQPPLTTPWESIGDDARQPFIAFAARRSLITSPTEARRVIRRHLETSAHAAGRRPLALPRLVQRVTEGSTVAPGAVEEDR